MKKVLALVLALVMVASLLVTPAFAAGSKQDLVEVEKVENATVAKSTAPEVKVEEIAKAVETLTEEEVEAFKELGIDVAKAEQTVVEQLDVKVEAGKTAKLTVAVEGVKDAYIAAWVKLADGTMKLLGVGKPPLDVEMTESGTLVVTVVK